MPIKLNIPSTQFRVAILGVFALTMLLGAALGNIVGPTFFLVFVGGFWALLGIAVYAGWITLVLRCSQCGADAVLVFEFRSGPVGNRNYPIIKCKKCHAQEIV